MPAPLPSLQHIDLAVFLRSAGLESMDDDPAFLAEIIEIFQATMPPTIEELTATHAQGDWKELKRHSHSLKGTVPTFGADKLAAIAVELDVAVGAQDAAETDRLIADVLAEFQQVLAELDQVLAYARNQATSR